MINNEKWKPLQESYDEKLTKIKNRLVKSEQQSLDTLKLEDNSNDEKRRNELKLLIMKQSKSKEIKELKVSTMELRKINGNKTTKEIQEAEKLIKSHEIQKQELLKSKLVNAEKEKDIKTMIDIIKDLKADNTNIDQTYLEDFEKKILKLQNQEKFREQFDSIKVLLDKALEKKDNQTFYDSLDSMHSLMKSDTAASLEKSYFEECNSVIEKYGKISEKPKTNNLKKVSTESPKSEEQNQKIETMKEVFGKLESKKKLSKIEDKDLFLYTDDHYIRLKEAVESMEKLSKLGAVLGSKDQVLFSNCQKAVQIIEVDREKRKKQIVIELQQVRQVLETTVDNCTELQNSIDSLNNLKSKSKHFPGVFTDKDESLLQKSEENLRERQRFNEQLQSIRSQFPRVPNDLNSLKKVIRELEKLESDGKSLPGTFRDEDKVYLKDCKLKMQQLETNIKKTEEVSKKLKKSLSAKDFAAISELIKEAEEKKLNLDEKELKEAKSRLDFLNPQVRENAIRSAAKSKDTEKLRRAIEDFVDAEVKSHGDFLEKAKRILRSQEKEERKKKEKEEKMKSHQNQVEKFDEDLQKAITSNNLQNLEVIFKEIEKTKVSLHELKSIVDAKALYYKLKKESLFDLYNQSIKERNTKMLNQFIKEAKTERYSKEFVNEITEAEIHYNHLKELDRLQAKLSVRATVAEVGRYTNPPQMVKVVMGCVLILLGDSQKESEDWHHVLNAVLKPGKKSVPQRIKNRSPYDISEDIRKVVRSKLSQTELSEVNSVSIVAGYFLAWIKCMLKEFEILKTTKAAEN